MKNNENPLSGGVRQPYRVMMGLYLGAFVGMFGETALNIALPALTAAFHVDTALMQWMVIGHMLVIGLVLPFASLLMKHFSVRGLTIFALLAFIAGSLVSGFAPDFGVLLAGRMIQGFGPGLILPLMFSMVLQVFPKDRIGAAMGLCALIIMFAPAIGPTLAGFVIGALGWRWIFFLFALILAVALVFACIYMVSPYELTKPRIDLLSCIGSIVGFCGLVLLPGGLMNAVFSLVSGRLYDRIGARIPAVIGFTLAAAGVVLMLFTSTTSPLWYVILCHVILLIGVPLAMSPSQTAALSSLPHELSTDGSTILNTLQQVWGAVATAVATSLLGIGMAAYNGDVATPEGLQAQFTSGFHYGLLFTLALAVAGIGMAFSLKKRGTTAAVAEAPTAVSLESLMKRDLRKVSVLDGGRLVGIINRSNIVKYALNLYSSR